MLKMNYWTDKWDLHEDICPCDVHFNDWTDAQKIRGKTIFHFGTGTHHVIGVKQAEKGNLVYGITASVEEYELYIKLVTENAKVAKNYLAYFGDIYLTNPRLLPDLDIVALFHLGEFIHETTTSAEYGGLDDLGLTRALLSKTRADGRLLIFTGSFAHDKAEAVAAELERRGEVAFVSAYKTLLVYRKTS